MAIVYESKSDPALNTLITQYNHNLKSCIKNLAPSAGKSLDTRARLFKAAAAYLLELISNADTRKDQEWMKEHFLPKNGKGQAGRQACKRSAHLRDSVNH